MPPQPPTTQAPSKPTTPPPERSRLLSRPRNLLPEIYKRPSARLPPAVSRAISSTIRSQYFVDCKGEPADQTQYAGGKLRYIVDVEWTPEEAERLREDPPGDRELQWIEERGSNWTEEHIPSSLLLEWVSRKEYEAYGRQLDELERKEEEEAERVRKAEEQELRMRRLAAQNGKKTGGVASGWKGRPPGSKVVNGKLVFPRKTTDTTVGDGGEDSGSAMELIGEVDKDSGNVESGSGMGGSLEGDVDEGLGSMDDVDQDEPMDEPEPEPEPLDEAEEWAANKSSVYDQSVTSTPRTTVEVRSPAKATIVSTRRRDRVSPGQRDGYPQSTLTSMFKPKPKPNVKSKSQEPSQQQTPQIMLRSPLGGSRLGSSSPESLDRQVLQSSIPAAKDQPEPKMSDKSTTSSASASSSELQLRAEAQRKRAATTTVSRSSSKKARLSRDRDASASPNGLAEAITSGSSIEICEDGPDNIPGSQEQVVAKEITGIRIRKRKMEYRVLWEQRNEATWEPVALLEEAGIGGLIDEFHETGGVSEKKVRKKMARYADFDF